MPYERFLDTIGRVKRELELKMVVHTGIIEQSIAKKLKEIGVDAALIDIIGSEATIREIYNLDVHLEDYESSLKALNASGMVFVPHVVVGLHYGKLQGEFKALKMISTYDPDAVVIIALIPIKGTALEDCEPPSPEAIARVLASAKIMMPNTPLALGCMRPTGSHRRRTDELAVKAGVDAIAFPERNAVELAKSMSLKMSFSPWCCSQIYEDLWDK